MDKKDTAIGVALLALAAGLLFYNSREQEKYAREHPPAPAVVATPSPVAPAAPAPAATPATPSQPERVEMLDNGVVRVACTTHGGAIKTVSLLRHASEQGKVAKDSPVVFNECGAAPAFALAFPDAAGAPVAFAGDFAVKSRDASRIVFEAQTEDGLVITREYALADRDAAEPHNIAAKTTFRREKESPAPLRVSMDIGSPEPVPGDPPDFFLNASVYDGSGYEKVGTDRFHSSSGFLGLGAHAAESVVLLSTPSEKLEKPIRWLAVSNQFFAAIATFDASSRPFITGLRVTPVPLPAGKFVPHDPTHPHLTVAGSAQLDFGALKAGEEKSVSCAYFVGPKEYKRLAELGDGQPHVVQFNKLLGFISIDWLCKLLVAALGLIHTVYEALSSSGGWNWGWAIVTLTILVKAVTWPLTAMQLRSAEKMKRLKEPMEALKKKYGDKPQKLQQETMALYRNTGVNPAAGCLPALLQLPIFCGLYYAFQTCAELRHQPFLWVTDLSVADTIPGVPELNIAGFAIALHVLPILMAVAMFLNMRLTPMEGMDKNQKTMFYTMMFIVPVVCYSSPAGLSTYWTVNNFLTLLQTWLRKRAAAKATGVEKTPVVEIIPPAKETKKKGKKS